MKLVFFLLAFAHIIASVSASAQSEIDRIVTQAFMQASGDTKNTTSIPVEAIPQSCTTNCDQNTLTAISSCTKASCMCFNETATAIQSCTSCIVTSGQMDAKVETAVLRTFQGICTTIGAPVTQLVSNGSTRIQAGMLVIGAVAAMLVVVV